MKREFPKWGKTVTTKAGRGKVVRQNILKRTITIQLEDGQEIEVGLDDIPTGPETSKEPDSRENETSEETNTVEPGLPVDVVHAKNGDFEKIEE